MRRFIALAVIALFVTGAAPAAMASSDLATAVVYDPPVTGPVVDGFRPPITLYGAGNRGLDYATRPGDEVRAAADGFVTFAGQVAGALHVVVAHSDGVRTSYSFLAQVAVREGERVARGRALGRAGSSFHFGARVGGRYLDPSVLFGGVAVSDAIRLVADDGLPLDAHLDDRGLLAAVVVAAGGVVRPVAAVSARWAGTATSAVAATTAAGAVAGAVRLPPGLDVVAGAGWSSLAAVPSFVAGEECTRRDVPPPTLTARHVAVLVGGLGSSSGHASVLSVRAATLGYAAADVLQFSYRGGTTTTSTYAAADTTVDLRRSAARLRALLRAVTAAHPGVPLDVIAHSQGGLVARAALATGPVAGVAALITLGTPHHGAPLATAMAVTRRTVSGRAAQQGLRALTHSPLPVPSPGVAQLAETSDFVRWLDSVPLPEHVQVTSIAARGDLVVPSPRAWLEGADNVVVPVGGLDQHTTLPGSPAATREIALALAHRPPTCEGLVRRLADVVAGEIITQDEQLLTASLAAGAFAADGAMLGL